MLTYKIYTFGCKANQYDSALLEKTLCSDFGFNSAKGNSAPDLLLVNTCSVTGSAGAQARQRIRSLKKKYPQSKLFVLGCYSKSDSGEIEEIGVSEIIKGTATYDLKRSISRHFDLENTGNEDNSPFLTDFPGHTRAFLKIQDGCESFCSYCIVPFLRGKPKSMQSEKILEQIKIFHDNGYREVVLTGIHLGMYGRDLDNGNSLLTLIEYLEKKSPITRLRLSSLEPDELSKEMIDFLKVSNVFVNHLHLPIQSGDDSVLKAMKRKYSVKYFKDLISHIKEAMPECGIGSDIIAGFPGETDEMFQNTVAAIKNIPLSYLHVFPYSARKGTKAYGMDGKVRDVEIKRRVQKLIALGANKKETFLNSLLGTEQLVLFESRVDRETGKKQGFSRNYAKVLLDSDLRSDCIDEVKVIISKVNEDGVFGKTL